MTDLAEFLLARIAEDEAAARGAWPETWQVEGNNVVTAETGLHAGYEGLQMGVAHLAMTVGNYQTEARNAAHIARHDPARVLAECEAKRRIVDAYLDERSRRDVYQRDDAMAAEDEKQRTSRRSSAARTRGLEIALEALALPYASHPDYDETWRP